MNHEKLWKLTMTGLFAALSYVVFTFLQIKIPLPGGDATSIHFGNAICVLGSLVLGFNVIADPLLGYVYKLAILGQPAAQVTLAWNFASTSINAVTSCIASVAIFMALRPALRHSGLMAHHR